MGGGEGSGWDLGADTTAWNAGRRGGDGTTPAVGIGRRGRDGTGTCGRATAGNTRTGKLDTGTGGALVDVVVPTPALAARHGWPGRKMPTPAVGRRGGPTMGRWRGGDGTTPAVDIGRWRGGDGTTPAVGIGRRGRDGTGLCGRATAGNTRTGKLDTGTRGALVDVVVLATVEVSVQLVVVADRKSIFRKANVFSASAWFSQLFLIDLK